jgi:hypothetical protein
VKPFVLLGAAGRRYIDAQEVCMEWWDGMPFATLDGGTCTVRDSTVLLAYEYTHVQILDFEMHHTLALLYLGTLTED